MRKIIAATLVSVNGYFTGPNGEQDWEFPYLSKELKRWIVDENRGQDIIILGETTYNVLKNYWPNMSPDQDPSAAFMNNTPKIVISKTLREAPWGNFNNATVLGKNVFEEIRKQKQQPGKNLVIVGSGSIVQQFTNHGLVDEYDLIMLPIILTKGIPLFANIGGNHALQLLEVKAFPDGTVMHRYKPAKQ